MSLDETIKHEDEVTEEQIEVVIKIPKYYLTRPQYYSDLAESVRRGVQLPKGHGRLGDLDALEKEMKDYSEGAFAMTPEFLVKHALTIIEADKESDTE